MVIPYVVDQYPRSVKSRYTSPGIMDYVESTGKVLSGAAYAANVLSAGVKDAVQASENLNEAFDAVSGKSSGSARTSSEAGVTIDSTSKKARIGNVTQRTPVGFSALNDPSRFAGIGGGATALLGNKTSPPIQLKLGAQLSSTTSIENFLSLFNQTGTISSSFGGRLLVPQDQRSRIFHCFRHNLHAQPSTALPNQGITDNAPYPSGSNILTIQGDVSVIGKTISNAPIQTLTNGDVYYAPYNKPDLEDVSFNLNKFKLGVQYEGEDVLATDDTADHGNTTVGMFPTAPPYVKQKIALLNDVTLMQTGSHRCQSAIYQNNTLSSYFTSADSYQSAPYKYDAVLKQGTVDYLFMNKGVGPLVVEVVVYCVKKNGVQGVPSKFSDMNLTNQLEKVISEGNFQKYLGGFGTDNLSSATGINTRSSTSWYTDPDLPYLPSCRQVDQSNLAYKEAQRVKVCLQPGERRPFQLKLGGEKYDPSNLVKRAKGGSSTTPEGVPIFDRHSYIVALVVNGMPQSRQLNLNQNADDLAKVIVGDCFGLADFQFTANYTESIGAMAYKKCSARHLFTNGNSPSMHDALTSYNNAQTLEVNKFESTPVVIVDQARSVRTGDFSSGGSTNVFS